MVMGATEWPANLPVDLPDSMHTTGNVHHSAQRRCRLSCTEGPDRATRFTSTSVCGWERACSVSSYCCCPAPCSWWMVATIYANNRPARESIIASCWETTHYYRGTQHMHTDTPSMTIQTLFFQCLHTLPQQHSLVLVSLQSLLLSAAALLFITHN